MDKESKVGEVTLAAGTDNVSASGVGSCLVITLYDARTRIGAVAHAMLPDVPTRHSDRSGRDTRYVRSAIGEMITLMLAAGARRESIEAKIVGGANMFSAAFDSGIGHDNVLTAKQTLAEQGILLIGECVGGSKGRSVEFCAANGVVTVKTKF